MISMIDCLFSPHQIDRLAVVTLDDHLRRFSGEDRRRVFIAAAARPSHSRILAVNQLDHFALYFVIVFSNGHTSPRIIPAPDF